MATPEPPQLTGFSPAGEETLRNVVSSLPVDPAGTIVAVERTLTPIPSDLVIAKGQPYLQLHVRMRSTSDDDVLYGQWLGAVAGSLDQKQVGDDDDDSIGGVMLSLETSSGALDWHGLLF